MQEVQQLKPEYVLAKSLINASSQLGLKQDELAAILGIHRTGITRLKKSMELEPNTKSGEIALLLIRCASALKHLSGRDEKWVKQFMREQNLILGEVPVVMAQQIQGLVELVNCVEALQTRV